MSLEHNIAVPRRGVSDSERCPTTGEVLANGPKNYNHPGRFQLPGFERSFIDDFLFALAVGNVRGTTVFDEIRTEFCYGIHYLPISLVLIVTHLGYARIVTIGREIPSRTGGIPKPRARLLSIW